MYTQDNGKIASFKIVQDFTKFGDKVYRKQSVNIAFIKADHSFNQIERVEIEDKEVTDVD